MKNSKKLLQSIEFTRDLGKTFMDLNDWCKNTITDNIKVNSKKPSFIRADAFLCIKKKANALQFGGSFGKRLSILQAWQSGTRVINCRASTNWIRSNLNEVHTCPSQKQISEMSTVHWEN